MITHLTLSLLQLSLGQDHATTQTQTQTPVYLPLQINQGECGDSQAIHTLFQRILNSHK